MSMSFYSLNTQSFYIIRYNSILTVMHYRNVLYPEYIVSGIHCVRNMLHPEYFLYFLYFCPYKIPAYLSCRHRCPTIITIILAYVMFGKQWAELLYRLWCNFLHVALEFFCSRLFLPNISPN